MPRPPESERQFEAPGLEEEVARISLTVDNQQHTIEDMQLKIDSLMQVAAKVGQLCEEVKELQSVVRRLKG